MLLFSFFTAVFSSAFWLIYSLMFVHNKLSDGGLFSQDIQLMLMYTCAIFLPIFVIWAVFGYINQFLNNRSLNRKQSELLNQLQKNQDYTDLVVRVMLDAEHEIKDGFVLNKFDVFINDMNEALGEVIQRCNIASSSQLDQLWQRVRRGERWALGKAVVEAGKNQNTFNAWVKEKVDRDKVFRGSLLEFCSRYQNLLQLLERHDRDRVFINMIEAGVFGKVYSLIAPFGEDIQEKFPKEEEKFVGVSAVQKTNEYASALKLATMEEPKAEESIVHVDLTDEEREDAFAEDKMPQTSLFSRLNIFKKSKPAEEMHSETVDDPFFKALHNSFQGEDEPQDSSPSLSAEPQNYFEKPVTAEPSPSFGKLEDTLQSLRASRESDNNGNDEVPGRNFDKFEPLFAEGKKPAEPVARKEEEEDLVYPFGGWTDEENYRQ